MRSLLLAMASLALIGCGGAAAGDKADERTILFLTDFGTRDGAVAVCKGVMWEIDPSVRIVDISHSIQAYDVESAGEVLEQSIPYFPGGTVVVAVVDPGVGSARKSIAILTKKGHLLVGPDNGLFTLVMEAEGVERAVQLTNRRYQREGTTSYTFHGRDIFSPAGAYLARGTPLDSLGPPVTPIRLNTRAARLTPGGIEGVVRYVEDPFGNVVTNITPALLDSAGFRVGDTLAVQLGNRAMRLPWRNTFSDVAVGEPLAVMHERALLSFSINQADFAAKHGTRRRDAVTIRRQ